MRVALAMTLGVGLCWCERLLVETVDTSVPLLVPKTYGLVIVMLVASFFVLFYLGLQVAQARAQFKDKAAKDGDENAEARFSYPKLYAEGFSDAAKHFNCIQRAHQQTLETYTSFCVMSLLGGLRHPLLVSAGGALWCYARIEWARGYATGDPAKRYTNSAFGFHIWTALFLVASAALSTAIFLLFLC